MPSRPGRSRVKTWGGSTQQKRDRNILGGARGVGKGPKEREGVVHSDSNDVMHLMKEKKRLRNRLTKMGRDRRLLRG